MGVYIKGMEMPKDCLSCPCMVSDCEGDMCAFQSYEENATFEDWEQMKASCPLVPVPPHGDLIDKQVADEMNKADYEAIGHDRYTDYARGVVLNCLNAVPIVIEADDTDINVPNKEEGER